MSKDKRFFIFELFQQCYIELVQRDLSLAGKCPAMEVETDVYESPDFDNESKFVLMDLGLSIP